MNNANAALAAALMGTGHVRDNTKSSGEASGSAVNQEAGNDNRVVNLGLVDPDVDTTPLNPRKRARSAVQTEMFGNMKSNCGVEQECPKGVFTKQPDFGPHEPAPISPEERNFIGFLSDLPSKKEWEEMGKDSATSLFEDMMGVYGQVYSSPDLYCAFLYLSSNFVCVSVSAGSSDGWLCGHGPERDSHNQ